MHLLSSCSLLHRICPESCKGSQVNSCLSPLTRQGKSYKCMNSELNSKLNGWCEINLPWILHLSSLPVNFISSETPLNRCHPQLVRVWYPLFLSRLVLFEMRWLIKHTSTLCVSRSLFLSLLTVEFVITHQCVYIWIPVLLLTECMCCSWSSLFAMRACGPVVAVAVALALLSVIVQVVFHVIPLPLQFYYYLFYYTLAGTKWVKRFTDSNHLFFYTCTLQTHNTASTFANDQMLLSARISMYFVILLMLPPDEMRHWAMRWNSRAIIIKVCLLALFCLFYHFHHSMDTLCRTEERPHVTQHNTERGPGQMRMNRKMSYHKRHLLFPSL